jgi:hypothetical protein
VSPLVSKTKSYGLFSPLKKPTQIVEMVANGQLVFTDVDKVTFKGVGNASNAVIDTTTGKIGVGVDSPDANLHVLGNCFVSTNFELGGTMTMGTVTVRAQHELSAITATGNTTPHTVEFQNAETGLVTTGNVEVGGELTVSGNTFYTNPMSISLDSNVVTEYTGPHSRGVAPLKKYPEIAFDASKADTFANSNAYAQAGYVVSASSSLTSSPAYSVFDATGATSFWHSQYPYYTFVTGTYNPGQASLGTGTPSGTLPTTELISGHQGEWIKLQMPKKIKLEEVRVYASNRAAGTNVYQMPKDIAIAGSNDGTNWYLVDSGTLRTGIRESYGMTSLPVTTSSYYSYLALIVKTIDNQGANYSAIEIANIEYYGREEGSGSLDTTLKSVYNVPATTGTQLEVYYDAKDLTAMPSTVTDLAGGDQNGAVTGHSPTLDTTDGIESFKFDGVDDYITTTLTNPNTDWVHSASMWVYPIDVSDDSVNGYIFAIGSDVSNQVSALRVKPDGFAYTRWQNGGSKTFNGPVTSGRWHHVTLISPGSTGVQVYLDGRLLTHTSDSLTTLTLPQNTSLSVGRFAASASYSRPFNGSIANFRLYSKALNADQIKELYDYQKDYFLGSKSQVTLYKGHLGVGVTEPSGQLELAGDERIQSIPPRGLERTPRQVSDGITADEFVEGHGVFNVSASGGQNVNYNGAQFVFHRQSPFTAVAGDLNYWSRAGVYNSSGTHTGDAKTSMKDGSTLGGEWIQLSSPYGYYLKKTVLYHRYVTNTPTWERARMPKDFTFVGSNNGSSWSVIKSFGNISYEALTGKDLEIDSKNVYKDVRLIVHSIVAVNPDGVSGNETTLDIGQWHLFGTPGPTTLDKGSLSLTRSLDVPRISRYDVDTETPRPEKLVVDFDTTVNESPTDISGRGNNGAFYNGAYYSAADKAFSFDGVDDYIRTSIAIAGGNMAWTQSMWFKVTAFPTDSNHYAVLSFFGNKSSLSGFITTYRAGQMWQDWYGNGVYFDYTFEVGQWYHAVSVYHGNTSTDPNVRSSMYINGVKQTLTFYSATSAPMTLPTSTSYELADYINASNIRHNGLISNPKLYNVALEPSEVQKLYRLGRTGRSMVISDTAVGIGKVPEAQLDVRGSISATGSLVTGGSSYVGGLPSSSFDYLNPSLHVNSLPKNILRLQVQNSGGIPTYDDFPNLSIKTIMSNGGDSLLDAAVNHYYDIAKDPYGRSCIVFRCRGTQPFLCGGWNRLNVRASYRRSYMSVVFVKRAGTASSGAKFYHGCSTANTADFSGIRDSNPYFQYIDYNTLPNGVWCVSIGFVHFKGASSSYSTGKAGMYRLDTMTKIDSGTEYTFYDEYDEQAQRAFFYNNSLSGAYLDFWNPGWFDTQTIFPETDILNVFTNDLVETSDDRLKSDERFIRGALDSIMKLKPQLYKKHLALDSVDETVQEESGLMAQDIYYDTPELRHVVKPGEDYGAIKSIVPIQSDDPNADPDYTEWGKNPAKVDYRGLIPYTIKAIQELNTEMTRSKFRIVGVPYSRLMDYTGLCVRSTTKDEVELTTFSNDKSVVGVISSTQNMNEYEDSEVLVDIVGKGGIWVIDTGSIHNGDYLTTSNIVSGYAQVQTDDLVHSYTVAKALQDVDFTEVQKPVRIIKQELSNVSRWIKREYRTVSKDTYDKLDENVRCITTTTLPTSDDEIEEQTLDTYNEIIIHESRVQIPGYELDVRQELVNVLDEHGQLQWEDDPSGATEKAYKIRYLDANGNITDEANAVHKAAFVGCTYHCG